jgi:hypothetical protein
VRPCRSLPVRPCRSKFEEETLLCRALCVLCTLSPVSEIVEMAAAPWSSNNLPTARLLRRQSAASSTSCMSTSPACLKQEPWGAERGGDPSRCALSRPSLFCLVRRSSSQSPLSNRTQIPEQRSEQGGGDGHGAPVSSPQTRTWPATFDHINLKQRTSCMYRNAPFGAAFTTRTLMSCRAVINHVVPQPL